MEHADRRTDGRRDGRARRVMRAIRQPHNNERRYGAEETIALYASAVASDAVFQFLPLLR